MPTTKIFYLCCECGQMYYTSHEAEWCEENHPNIDDLYSEAK